MYETLRILIDYFNNDIGRLIFDISFNFDRPFRTGLYEEVIKNKNLSNLDCYILCKNNYISIINYYINNFNFNIGLYGACKGGHIEIVKLMIKYGANDFNDGLRYACSGNHIEIVKLMIDKGADDFNKGLECACYGGHIKIAELMLDNGANNFNEGLYIAKYYNNKNIIKLLTLKLN